MNFVKSSIANCVVFAVSLMTLTFAFRLPQAQAEPVVLAGNGESFVEPLGQDWCTHPVKIVARGLWGQAIDPNKPEFRAMAQAAIAPVLRLCGRAQVIDLWFRWADHIELLGRASAETNWQWSPFRVPQTLARALRPPSHEIFKRRAPTREERAVPSPAQPVKPSAPPLYVLGGIAWGVLVVVSAVGKAAGSPAIRRVSSVALNILLAFVPIIFGGRPPDA